MSTVENIDVNKIKITFSVSADRFEEGMKYSYNKNKNRINVQGFRKGKAPRKIIEIQYGKAIFYDDAFNFVLPEAYEAAVKEHNLDVVSKPEIDVDEISDTEGVTFTAEVYVKPEVKIDDYKGLSFTKEEVKVDDEDVNSQIDAVRTKNARILSISDRPIQNGDIAVIDFEGFSEGVAFEGGKGEDYELEIGSHSFIDNFEEQLIGKNIGDDVEVNVTFPEEYHQKTLAGKPALFKVEIKDIKFRELPELDDDFAQDVSEFDTLDEYKKDIMAKLLVRKQKEADDKKQEELLDALVKKAEMDVPQVMIENEIDNKIREFEAGISRQGLSLEMYLQYMGQSIENMREAYRIVSERQVKSRLVLEAIAEKENFEISDEEIDEEIKRVASAYGMEVDKLKKSMRDSDREALSKDVKVQKALKLVVDSAVES
ncbi:MAG: trigger factor [Clostridiales bacterium]|nr:trigger factor [Clostridiales bacterium]